MKSSRVCSSFEAVFDLLFADSHNGNARFDVKLRLPHSNILADVKVVPNDWLETNGVIGSRLLAYLYRPQQLRCYYFLEFVSMFATAMNRRTRNGQDTNVLNAGLIPMREHNEANATGWIPILTMHDNEHGRKKRRNSSRTRQ